MPYIIKNGLTYTGNLMPITQDQYEALSEAEKNNGIAYFIVDSDAVLDASDVGLGEGNVEDLAGSVAVIETSPATAVHSVGDFILWDGQLYTVTSAIAVGETLTVGSNITATSAGSEISALKSGLINLKNADASFGQIEANGGYETVTINISANPSKYKIIAGYSVSGASVLSVSIIRVVDSNTIQVRVINPSTARVTSGAGITVYYL